MRIESCGDRILHNGDEYVEQDIKIANGVNKMRRKIDEEVILFIQSLLIVSGLFVSAAIFPHLMGIVLNI